MPPASEERPYVLGTNDDELIRLGFQHRLWGQYAFAAWERAGFRPGHTILDVGCGPGFAAFDLAAFVGQSGRVIGIDASTRFISHLEVQARARGLTNISARVGDVAVMDLPANSIDGAWARWVLCFVSDPEAVIRNVARALRPGGAFVVQDYFNYRAVSLAPRSPAFERVIRAVEESWKVRGGDPDIVGRLPALMHALGLEVREINPILRTGTPASTLWHWPGTFFRNYLPILLDMGLITAADRAAFESDWEKRSADPHTFFMSPPVFDVIALKR